MAHHRWAFQDRQLRQDVCEPFRVRDLAAPRRAGQCRQELPVGQRVLLFVRVAQYLHVERAAVDLRLTLVGSQLQLERLARRPVGECLDERQRQGIVLGLRVEL